ncbi:MAG: site-2 protease family protein [Candidatus Jorgensenbacteria bacterium]|nr:site-2 protease family protein [Candidatus Jorgensenbacteria bacterium]
MDSILFVFKLIVLVFSVVIHEISHGFVAERFGDPTARRAGRLTLNPIKHIDLFGSIILPLLMAIIPGGVVFGWAKPVPINPRNFRNPDRDTAIVSAAGPLSNITLAFVFGIFIRILSAGPITN